MKPRPVDHDTMELAFRAVDLRAELDAVLARHHAHLELGFSGAWAYLQVHFAGQGTGKALTLCKTHRDGRSRYYREAEDVQAAGSRGGKPSPAWEVDALPALVAWFDTLADMAGWTRDSATAAYHVRDLAAAQELPTVDGLVQRLAELASPDPFGVEVVDLRQAQQVVRKAAGLAKAPTDSLAVRVFFRRGSGGEDSLVVTGNPLDHVSAELITRVEPADLGVAHG